MIRLLDLRRRYWLRRRDRAHAKAGRLAVAIWDAIPAHRDGGSVE